LLAQARRGRTAWTAQSIDPSSCLSKYIVLPTSRSMRVLSRKAEALVVRLTEDPLRANPPRQRRIGWVCWPRVPRSLSWLPPDKVNRARFRVAKSRPRPKAREGGLRTDPQPASSKEYCTVPFKGRLSRCGSGFAPSLQVAFYLELDPPTAHGSVSHMHNKRRQPI
jgi:hypothetical protein